MMVRYAFVPPDDEPSGYAYKVRSSGLADLSRLRLTITGIYSRAGKIPRHPTLEDVQGLES